MRKVFKVILIIVVLIIVVAGAFALFVNFRGMPVYKKETITMKVESSPERVARGKKLASMLCRSCHYNEQTQKFTGRLLSEAPQFGEIHSANITKDPIAGIGNLSDGDLIYYQDRC